MLFEQLFFNENDLTMSLVSFSGLRNRTENISLCASGDCTLGIFHPWVYFVDLCFRRPFSH